MSQNGTKYPDIQGRLTGQDGKAFVLLSAVARGLRRGGHAGEVDAFMKEAMDGDYDHLLCVCMKWVDVS